jgi:trimethylamine--corrinoid protein Co-methyltransferase
MITPYGKMLGDTEIGYIHGKSLKLLQEVGIQFNSKKALAILADAGCQVDQEKLVAKIPPDLVEKCLQTLPQQFPMAAMDPAKDFVCGDGRLYYTAPGQCPYFKDLDTRKRRPATTQDLIISSQISEELDIIQQWCPMVLPNDVSPEMRTLRTYQVAFKYVTKNMLGGAEQIVDVPYILEMMDVVLGDRERLKERPIMSLVINPSSPLKTGGQLVDIILEFMPYKLPIFLQFLPLAGATSPITLAGTIVQSNAEFLGNMTLFQTAAPGWPIIWALATGILDMRSGRYAGGPESALMTFALLEMSKHYGVPSNSFGSSSSEANSIGYQNGIEAMFGLLLFGALGGVDNFWFPADMDGFNLMDLANVILATEPIRQIDRFIKGLKLDDEHTMLETMLKLGHEASYLKEPSTMKYLKEEHLLPDLFPRDTYENWVARNQTEEELALERVRELLAKHEPKEFSPEAEKEIEKIISAAEKAYST